MQSSVLWSVCVMLILGQCRPASRAQDDAAAQHRKPNKADSSSLSKKPAEEIAIFAGGCFWCMEAAFDKVPGVSATTSGYIGGHSANPSYEEVSEGNTGHFEAVRVTYNPNKVSYSKLLDVFWHNIDPMAKDRQFCDVGKQYRSAIFYRTPAEQDLASKSKLAVQKRLKRTPFTQILAAGPFYVAETYHQDFYKKQPQRYQSYKLQCGRDQRLEELRSAP